MNTQSTVSPSAQYRTPANRLRTVRFTPYRKGMGPTFTLTTWDTNTRDHMGKNRLAYQLKQHTTIFHTHAVADVRKKTKTVVLFDGADFCCAPRHAVDSNSAVECLMGFLTLRPGDTDREYFDKYTEEQKEFCAQHAETLGCEVQARFCDENGRVIE